MIKILVNFWWNHVSSTDKQFIMHQHYCGGRDNCMVSEKKYVSLEAKCLFFETYHKERNNKMSESDMIAYFKFCKLSSTDFLIYLRHVQNVQTNIFSIEGYFYSWIYDYTQYIEIPKLEQQQIYIDESKSLNCID